MKDFIIESAVITFIYTLALVLIIIRRASPYILRRSPIMLTISLIGNYFQSLICLSQIDELEKSMKSDFTESCFIFYRISAMGVAEILLGFNS